MSHHFALISEKEFSQRVKEQAEALGWLVGRVWNSQNSPAGFPDLTMVRGQRLIFAELKSMKGKVSEHQQTWLERLSEVQSPVEVYVWRPSDEDKIDKVLAQ